MSNIITLNNKPEILSQEEIELLLKGFVKLIEKNTEQKLKLNLTGENFNSLNSLSLKDKKYNLPNLSVETIKSLEELKNSAIKIFDENKKLKKQIETLKNKVLELRNELINKKCDIKY